MLHIIGAGSIGLLWAVRLQQAGLPVTLILRNAERLAAWQQQQGQVELTDPAQQQHSSNSLAAELPEASTPIQRLIVATKAYAAEPAVRNLLSRLPPDAEIILLQNGMGSQQAISQLLDTRRVYYASVTDGAWRPSARQLIWAGHGQTLLGDPRQGPTPPWLADWQNRGLTVEWHQDISAVLWRKLAINCVINPLSVLHDCTNGELPALAQDRLQELTAELQQLLTTVGTPVSLDILRTQLDRIIHQTAANSSSMRQDVHAGRRTEIKYILGYALRCADRLALPLPALHRLEDELQTYLATHGLPIE